VRAAALDAPAQAQPWLIDHLWTHQAVGVIGGSPKAGKTWLALEMAVAVASGTPCLGAFAVHGTGPVLLYAAEDATAALRSRLETLAAVHQVAFDQLDVRVITADTLRLDRPDHQARLHATLRAHRPALLVLDPLVRVHAIDENVAGQVAALLAYLRTLQRTTGTAIALVHHVRKNLPPATAAGYGLRGSSDLYAWLDSFLALRKHHDQLTLAAEHRSAPAFGPLRLTLTLADGVGPHLQLVTREQPIPMPRTETLADRILTVVRSAPDPLTLDTLRARLQVRNQRVVEALRHLVAAGKVRRLDHGYTAVSDPPLPIPS
jgi:hypothetical protein